MVQRDFVWAFVVRRPHARRHGFIHLEPYDVRNRRTVAHSVIKDLLSAGCIWTTEIDQWAL